VSIQYNLTGSARKTFAGVIGEVLALPVVYAGAPSFAYTVGDYTIDRYGNLSYSDTTRTGEVLWLIASLRERGYVADNVPIYGERSETERPPDANDRLVIEAPMTGFTPDKLDNLTNLVNSKDALFKKALSTDDLPVAIVDDKLRFPWFTLTEVDDETDAYGRFICAICDMAKRQKRVIAKAREIVNEKFTMRVFLIRLGFIGPEYKTARKILLKNLTGNCSWKYGRPDRITADNNGVNVVEPSENVVTPSVLSAAFENTEGIAK